MEFSDAFCRRLMGQNCSNRLQTVEQCEPRLKPEPAPVDRGNVKVMVMYRSPCKCKLRHTGSCKGSSCVGEAYQLQSRSSSA